MFLGFNGALDHSAKLAFPNGWAVVISARECEHVRIMVVPAFLYDAEFFECSPREFSAKISREIKAAKDRGDLYDHFKGNDAEILAFITGVASRKPYSGDLVDEMLSKVFKK